MLSKYHDHVFLNQYCPNEIFPYAHHSLPTSYPTNFQGKHPNENHKSVSSGVCFTLTH
uniref:Uncharacterized protein n=1 Tax=Arion vulgaris TaxID=1028688 RepID=A0A0B7AWL3_9EUPU